MNANANESCLQFDIAMDIVKELLNKDSDLLSEFLICSSLPSEAGFDF